LQKKKKKKNVHKNFFFVFPTTFSVLNFSIGIFFRKLLFSFLIILEEAREVNGSRADVSSSVGGYRVGSSFLTVGLMNKVGKVCANIKMQIQ